MELSQIQDDLKKAQLARDEVKVSVLRMLLSEIHNAQIQKGRELSQEDVIYVIQRESKKRKEATQGFRQGGREEQAKKEEVERKILEDYLPAQASNEELTEIVDQAIKEIGASGIADVGKVMGIVMGKVAGGADGGRVSEMVKSRLTE